VKNGSEKRRTPIQIAIDGPSGAGKSTVAKAVAGRLNFIYVDTGAMYRALTWKALQKGIGLETGASLTGLAQALSIRFVRDEGGRQRVLCDGVDVTEAIRTPEIDRLVSRTAAHADIRQVMVKQQQNLAAGQDVVMDGRDVATVILPKAECKIYLTASLEQRAKRRFLELSQKGISQTYADILADMRNRDFQDETREASPLVMDPEAERLDTSEMNLEETIAAVLKICQNVSGVLRGGGRLREAQPVLSGCRTPPPEALSDSEGD
jgi:cytidylate kinase